MGTLTAHRDKLIIAECDIDTGAFCRNTDTWLGRTLTSSQRAHQKIKLKEIFFSLSLSPTCKHLSALSSWRIMDYGQSFKYVIGEDNDLPNADGIEKRKVHSGKFSKNDFLSTDKLDFRMALAGVGCQPDSARFSHYYFLFYFFSHVVSFASYFRRRWRLVAHFLKIRTSNIKKIQHCIRPFNACPIAN